MYVMYIYSTYTVHFREKQRVCPKMGDSPMLGYSSVTQTRMCQNIGTLLKIQNFGGVDNSYKYGAVQKALRKYKLGNVGEISYGIYIIHILYIYIYYIIYIYSSTSISENIFPPFSAEFLNDVEPTGQYQERSRPESSLQCLAALHDAHNHGLK